MLGALGGPSDQASKKPTAQTVDLQVLMAFRAPRRSTRAKEDGRVKSEGLQLEITLLGGAPQVYLTDVPCDIVIRQEGLDFIASQPSHSDPKARAALILNLKPQISIPSSNCIQ